MAGRDHRPDVGRAIEAYRARLAETLGESLESVVLYGSQARGDAVSGSDVDVLCIMKDAFDYGDLIRRTSGIAAEVSLQYDVVISTAFVSSRDYHTRRTPFLMNVRREGMTI